MTPPDDRLIQTIEDLKKGGWFVAVLGALGALMRLLLSQEAPGAVEWLRRILAGAIMGLLAYFAIGCPVCNKLVLLALGTTGAVNYFEPVQPYLAALGIVALAYAFHRRVMTADACALPEPETPEVAESLSGS